MNAITPDERTIAALDQVEVHIDDKGPWASHDAAKLIELSLAAVIAELRADDWPNRSEVGVLLGRDSEIADLNARWRGKPKPTNVLSWPTEAIAAGDPPPIYWGDLAFAYGVAQSEARERGTALETYLPVLAVHGLLHCLGYDHETDGEAVTMERTEAKVLARLGLPDPYAGTDPA